MLSIKATHHYYRKKHANRHGFFSPASYAFRLSIYQGPEVIISQEVVHGIKNHDSILNKSTALKVVRD